MKKKQERFSAFEKKANLREVMRDPLQRFKIFQHRNCKKNDAIGGGDLDKNSHQPLQNVIYKYEWDIRYSPSQVNLN